MSTKIGRLGHPRLAIALVWVIPADSREGTVPDAPPAPDPIPPEDVEFVREMTGLDPGELTSRLQRIADRFRDDPATLRQELVRLADGGELAAEEVIRLIRGIGPDNDNGHDDDEESKGEILDFGPHEEGEDR